MSSSSKNDGSVVFSRQEMEMLDHYLAEIEALKSKAEKNYIVSNDFDELSHFLDDPS